MNSREVSLRVTFIGAAGVGKTALVNKFSGIENNFDAAYEPTIGHDFRIHRATLTDNTTVKLQCYDTAGQEKFTDIAQSFLPKADIIVGCFDLERPETLNYLKSMLVGRAKQLRPGASMPRIVILGCKANLINDYTEVNNKFNKFLEALNKHDIAIEQNDRYDTISSKTDMQYQLLRKLQPTIDEVVKEKLAQQEKATPAVDATQSTVNDPIAPTPTSKPSALESVKNFFKNKNVRIGLIGFGIIIGFGLMCTGIGMLGVFCAGAVAAGGVAAAVSASMVATFGGAVGFTLSFTGFLLTGATMLLPGLSAFHNLGARIGMNTRTAQTPTGDGVKISLTDTQVTDTLSQEQSANGVKLPSEVAPEAHARILEQQRDEQNATPHQYSDANTLNQMGVYAASTTNPTLTETLTPPQQCTIS